MKNKGLKFVFLLLCVVEHATMNAQTINMKDTSAVNGLFPKGNKLSNEWFTGNAFLHPLVTKENNNEFAVGCVTFEPGARTNWHTHPKGQVLIITEGEGFYQEKGKVSQALKKGDVVNIPENTEHWHGASSHSMFIHIAITSFKDTQTVVWLTPVTNEEYSAAHKK